jgi:DNA repair protein SbcC/Rad50
MSLARFFSKPRWQSKDAGLRRQAVASETSPELVSQLAKFAREDVDAGVRLAAMRRLADPGLSQAMAQDDRDEGVRTAARSLFTELLAGTHASAPALADRLRLLRAQDDARLIEQIATSAPEAELRLAALKRVERPALILERVTADSDAAVRLAALERIADETQLARISERARKSDKTISRLAGERLHALRVERGDPEAISNQARALCEQLERLLREGDSAGEADTIAATWQGIADKAPAPLVSRYRNARELFELSRDPEKIARLRQRAEDRGQLESGLDALESALRHLSAHAQDELKSRYDALDELHARYADDNDEHGARLSVRFARLGAQLSAMKPEPEAVSESASETAFNAEKAAVDAERQAQKEAARLERERKQKELIGKFDEAIQKTAAAIAAGKTAEAHAAYALMSQLRREFTPVPPALRDALTDVESEYARIQEWQRWSDGNRRQQLCEELEVLPETGLHPDALATRVREIQNEWTTLARIEGRPGRANDGIDRRFRALCQKAIEPAKPYFEKRDELRKQGTEETSQLINEAKTAVAAEDPDWRSLNAMRKRSVEGLRALDRVDPRERKNLAAELKQVLSIIDERIAAQYAEIEAAKAALIGRAEALAEQADVRTAISQAKDLQKLWQTSGNGKRSRDQAQWNRFRAAVDAVFARADGERAARSAQEQEAHKAAEMLCDEFEAIVQSTSEPERGEVQRIESAWQALGSRDGTLRQRFAGAQSALQDMRARVEKNKRRVQFDVWTSHYALLRQFEGGQFDADALAAARSELPAMDIAADEYQQRVDSLRDSGSLAFGEADALRDYVLEIEQLAGIEAPEEDRQRRMDLQVEKLSARMRGAQAPSPAAALRELLAGWLTLGAVDDSNSSLEQRFKRALNATLDTLS